MIRAEVLVGDVREQLRTLPDASVHCIVTSPPYWGLRDYGLPPLVWDGDPGCEHEWGDSDHYGGGGQPSEKVRWQHTGDGPSGHPKVTTSTCSRCSAWRGGSLGLEPTPELYVEHLVAVFREVRRVLRDDGTCWINLGDGYAATRSYQVPDSKHVDVGNSKGSTVPPGLKPKDLMGVPWRLAFALQADGWWLRSDIIWAKPNPMPESVTDRPTKAHEYVFLLSKRATYYYDAEAVKEPLKQRVVAAKKAALHKSVPDDVARVDRYAATTEAYAPTSRNLRSVWWIATQPYPEAHFATFPESLVRPCILAGTSERGVCPTCGAPWERVVEKSGGTTGHSWHDHKDDLVQGQRSYGASDAFQSGDYQVRSLGWRPTCDHGNEPVPATVLDPFAGSGTTLLVAQSLGRHAIGVELSPAYAELAHRRLQQAALL